jgi:glyoxylase-like metal-dependent hydrolase (beta-lactamase superfamily II)
MHAVVPGIAVVPVLTPTLPPATHTNAWVVGEGRITVFDPASPYEDEQRRLWRSLQDRVDDGEVVERIVLTHHHHDHVSGAADLAARFDVPIVAHPATAALVRDRIAVTSTLADGETLECGGTTFDVLHTPGHAPGHLVFHDRATGAVIAGDMVAGVGTIVIDPRDGDLGQYLASLARMQALGATQLLPAHGPALEHPEQLLAFYIAHRHQRSEQIRAALSRLGQADAVEIAADVYAGQIPASVLPIAAVQVTSHLLWLEAHGVVSQEEGRWSARR